MLYDEDVCSMVDKEKSLEVPDHVIEAFARCLLPAIRKYFDTEKGQREFADWQAEGGDVEKKTRKKQ